MAEKKEGSDAGGGTKFGIGGRVGAGSGSIGFEGSIDVASGEREYTATFGYKSFSYSWNGVQGHSPTASKDLSIGLDFFRGPGWGVDVGLKDAELRFGFGLAGGLPAALEAIGYGFIRTDAFHKSFGTAIDVQKRLIEQKINQAPADVWLGSHAPAAGGFFVPNHCFMGTTRISTERGVTEIRNIKEGDWVLAHDRRGNIDKALVMRVFRGITTEWLILSCGVVVTPGHYFLNEFASFERIDELVARGGSSSWRMEHAAP